MIRLYDTLKRTKKELVPQDKRITMYVCGPTVYGRAHIGNARPAVVFDTLARLIRHVHPDHELVYARNVTDVDDKIIAAAREEGVDPSVITKRFEDFYLADMGALGVAPPTIAPHATQEIPAMVTMIGELIAKGNAYAAEGHVLFSVASDPEYGSFSRRDREAMVAGARVEVAPYKRDAADFVLWKPAVADEIGWDSPQYWGVRRGRPGWHIECSAMIRAHLGETIDIHGGGLDLIFPHHENEIAQSRCAHGGAPLARHWVHNGFVDMGAEKMSKSLGNVVTVDSLLAAGHDGFALRYSLLSVHHTKPLAWTNELVARSQKTLQELGGTLTSLFDHISDEADFTSQPHEPSAEAVAALSDDLNMGQFNAVLHSLANHINDIGDSSEARMLASQLVGSLALIGIDLGEFRSNVFDSVISEIKLDMIDAKVAARTAAKAARDFATADRIRDELAADGIMLEDGPAGTTWRRA